MSGHDVDSDTVMVIGSGPAGLATAAHLAARGVAVTVLERGPVIGAAWAARYDGLRFNTSRRYSALPGRPFPRSFGQFPSRDQYVEYLRTYAAAAGIRVETGCLVSSIDTDDGGGWVLETGDGARRARQVVVATGVFNVPAIPAWATSPPFEGPVLHSSAYRNAAELTERPVLVVGTGSTGLEIAYELAHAGAGAVLLSVRTPPNLLLREMGGLPGDLPVPLFLHLPAAPVDRLLLAMRRRVIGDLAPYGLPLPDEGPMTQLRRRGVGTAIVDDEALEAIRQGAVRVVPAVRSLTPDGAQLADGSHHRVSAVVLATGYRTGLDDLVGHLGVLDPDGMPLDRTGAEVAPGLRFVGYVYRPGLTGYVGRMARRVARGIARGTTSAPPRRTAPLDPEHDRPVA
ncbi:FAD-dependent pyridine nucleotide-disulphide oxidoreductase [Beutenbergia cavernae DSM 12333]|uniref:FAD-dependent pyridine nucleotide-disulphide oxidoreductase n=1 Tax=Beutenbergia cavernae (strain ATCC BAA-8 / DSM 12333 / CCUG 43141 / JCM 11478 / NBRC 16432 / NCIMB 13614 / HKI 0122) TaxID=471853 RepID=C5BZL2_BEUC1|nr:NAD(P)/FAD-dependent oxidoreductase [Beutenbergia cavernae]ACQ79184.1 FAD-dependent pyridine nucleotide-disulphide oxidoreductase [Beutenbergia cavernae DSM 12333]